MIGTPGGSPERPATFFSGPDEFRIWLEANHESSTELWVGLYKKHVSHLGLTYRQALEEALCFGWIDSISQRLDGDAVRQRWTPRKPGSNWSRVNVDLVAELTAQGRMHPAGLAAFERRRDDRTGVYFYEQDGEPVLPPDYEAELRANARATAFLVASIPSYRRHCTAWVVSAKQEATRRKRLAQLIDDSAHGRLIPSQRYGDAPGWLVRAAAAASEAAS
jgi:uncharacterized protein YdeI (YjbR/CyaY-like superfamily)